MDKPLSLIEHLAELRKRIIICLISLGIASLVTLPLASAILKILKLPAQGLIDRLAFFSPEEAFLIYFRIGILGGLFFSMPVILYQLWMFILPAIEDRGRQRIGSFIFFCFVAFVCGALFAYFLLIPPALKFLLSFAGHELEAVISASKYISFVIGLIIGCGFVFQMPILSFFLSKLGIINARLLRRKYKYAIAIIFILSAIITPTPDAFNMLLLAAPMLFLYEISIWVSFFSVARP